MKKIKQWIVSVPVVFLFYFLVASAMLGMIFFFGTKLSNFSLLGLLSLSLIALIHLLETVLIIIGKEVASFE